MKHRVLRLLVTACIALVTGGVAGSSMAGASETPRPVSAGRICYVAHVQGIGWQSAECDGRYAGTVGQGRRLEAIRIVSNVSDSICYQAHVQGIGWQGTRCDWEVAGTTGQGRRLEALRIWIPGSGPVVACYRAHVQGIGWQGTRCEREIAGTTGQSRRLEAIAIWDSPS